MADNFGLKIGVEGEKEFKKALAEINQTFKVLGSEMNLVASQFDKQDKSVEALSARNRVLNQEIDTQRQKISTLQQALQNATKLPMKLNVYTKEGLEAEKIEFTSQPDFKKLVEESEKFDNIMAYSDEIQKAQKIMKFIF